MRSASRLAPEGAPRSHSSAEDFELRAALEESSMRRAELVQRLREAKGHLDTQTDLLKSKGSQLQQSQSISNILEMKHKVWILLPHQLKQFEIYWILQLCFVWYWFDWLRHLMRWKRKEISKSAVVFKEHLSLLIVLPCSSCLKQWVLLNKTRKLQSWAALRRAAVEANYTTSEL